MSDPHAWPAHPHIDYLLTAIKELREGFRDQVHATSRDEHLERWETWKQAAEWAGEVETAARRHVGRPVQVSAPVSVQAPPAVEPVVEPARSPLDPSWQWETHDRGAR